MSVEIESGATDTANAWLLWDNIFEGGTVTVSSEMADGAGLNSIEDTTFDFWTPSVVYATLAVDYGSDVECDCVGIAAHDAGTNGSTIQVQSSPDNATWTTRATSAPLTDETIMICFDAATARYWRIGISGSTCSIGVAKLGKALVMPCGVLTGHVGINHANRVELLTNNSVTGQFLGTREKRVGAEANINFGLISAAFVDNDMMAFEAHFNSGRTFFYAGSPEDWPEDYGYCWRSSGEMRPSYEEGGTLAQVDIDVAVYVDG